MTALVVLWIVPAAASAALAAAALRWAWGARQARQQTVAVLGLVPELAGEVPPGTGARAAAAAAAMAYRLGHDASAAATAARLASTHPDVLTVSGIPPDIAAVVHAASNAERGQAGGVAAVVRVAVAYARRLGEAGAQPSGALFTTVVEYPRGDERRAAAALVQLVQDGSSSA